MLYALPSITNSTRVAAVPPTPRAAGRHVVHGDDRAVARPGRDGDGEVGAERLVQRIVERGRGCGAASSGSSRPGCGRGAGAGRRGRDADRVPPGQRDQLEAVAVVEIA